MPKRTREEKEYFELKSWYNALRMHTDMCYKIWCDELSRKSRFDERNVKLLEDDENKNTSIRLHKIIEDSINDEHLEVIYLVCGTSVPIHILEIRFFI